MIPKVAHFMWSGGEMSWIRHMGLESFKRYHPEWEVYVHETPDDIRQRQLSDPAQEADWNRWRILAQQGGFAIDTDIIFVKPIPDEWLDTDLCVATGGTNRVWQMAVVGAQKGHPLPVCADMACDKYAGPNLEYQDLGVVLLARICKMLGGIADIPARLYDQPNEAICYFDWSHDPWKLWDPEDIELIDDVIGVHWYGGHECSKKMEASASEDGPSFIERLAAKHGDGIPTEVSNARVR